MAVIIVMLQFTPNISYIHKTCQQAVSRCFAAYVLFMKEMLGYSTISVKVNITSKLEY